MSGGRVQKGRPDHLQHRRDSVLLRGCHQLPYLKGEVNVSLGCDGSAKNAGLADEDVVVGIPFAMMEDICTVLKEHYQVWDKFMRG